MTTTTIKRMEEEYSKMFTPEQAFAQFEYLEYLEMQGEEVCQLEKTVFANIAQNCDWNVTG